MEPEMLDDDGYPSCAALAWITRWTPDKAGSYRPLLDAIRPVWRYANSGYWNYDWRTGIYHLSTAGWSGNESIIGALEDNRMFWFLCAQAWERGGHYQFRLYEDQPCMWCGLIDPQNKWHRHAEIT